VLPEIAPRYAGLGSRVCVASVFGIPIPYANDEISPVELRCEIAFDCCDDRRVGETTTESLVENAIFRSTDQR
jgi:hypothetical protein